MKLTTVSAHKLWLDNEYSEWVKALQSCTVDNFGSHSMVKRMLGDIDYLKYFNDQSCNWHNGVTANNLNMLSHLGGKFIGNIARCVYYAQQIIKLNPTHICEIGGGVGQFYAVLRALGYTGKYWIYDLPEVQAFQRKYLDRVTEITGLDTTLTPGGDYCVSFYAFGEFDDDLKQWYVENVISKCPHGFMIFNPHSGASDNIPFPCTVADEYPLTSPGNKQLTW